MQCSKTQTQEQIIDMKRYDFFYSDNSLLLLSVTYPWGTPELHQELPDILLPRHSGLHSTSPSPSDREGLVERVWQGTGSRSHAACRDPPQGLKVHVTNGIQKGTIVLLPYELWEIVWSQFSCTGWQETCKDVSLILIFLYWIHWEFEKMSEECKRGSFGSISHPFDYLYSLTEWVIQPSSFSYPLMPGKQSIFNTSLSYCEVCFLPVHK